LTRCSGFLLARGLLLLAATWRVEGADLVRVEIEKWSGTPLLLGFWHGKYLPLLVLLRGLRANVFIGEGLRGTLIAAICRSFGFSPLLLPHHDRRRALARIRAALVGLLPCATPFDGPVGPPRSVKPALLELAIERGATILPLSMSGKPCAVLRWRWDRREIPWPFARVTIRVGDPIQVPAGLPSDARAAWCERVKAALDSIDAVSIAQPRTSK
jgi:lysophospholipid acyltransferase (LPLAT)-like uncharacterized protein